MMSWFKKGIEGLNEKKKLDKVAELRKEKNVPRFWLKKNERAKIIFLDDEGFYCYVHQLNINGRWDNFVTCPGETRPCPICESGDRPTFCAHYSVIDLRSYTKQDGTQVKYSKKILPAKSSAIHRLYDLKKKHGSLVGMLVEVIRYENDPNCGGTFEVLGKVKGFEKKFSKDDRTPFNLEKILQPPTPQEFRDLGYIVDDVLADDNVDDTEPEIDVDEIDNTPSEIDVDDELKEEEINVEEDEGEEDEIF